MDAGFASGKIAGRKGFGLPAHIILADRIQAMIKSGELKPGHRFPPTKEFASQLDTYPLAVHEAFKILSGGGLVERRHRSGTFVSSNSSVLGSAAIYLGIDIMGADYLSFYRLVYAELTALLKKEGVRYATLLDPRSDDEQDKPWEELVKVLERKKYQGVVAFAADDARMKWLSRLPVPVGGLIDLDCRMDDFSEKSIAALKEKGCRSVGLITSFSKKSVRFPERFVEIARRNKMKISDRWVEIPEGDSWVQGSQMERYGYERFLKLWDSKQRPDGLAVYPDILLPGIISAMMQLRVRAPEDLKFTIHMNKGNGLVCPFPATFIVTDPKDFAVAIIKQLKLKLSGQPTVPERIFFETVQLEPARKGKKRTPLAGLTTNKEQ